MLLLVKTWYFLKRQEDRQNGEYETRKKSRGQIEKTFRPGASSVVESNLLWKDKPVLYWGLRSICQLKKRVTHVWTDNVCCHGMRFLLLLLDGSGNCCPRLVLVAIHDCWPSRLTPAEKHRRVKNGRGWGQVLCSGLPVDQLLCRARDECHGAPHGTNRPSSTVFFPWIESNGSSSVEGQAVSSSVEKH